VVPGIANKLQLREFFDFARFSGTAKRETGGKIGGASRQRGARSLTIW
jgi:hypothetical protein